MNGRRGLTGSDCKSLHFSLTAEGEAVARAERGHTGVDGVLMIGRRCTAHAWSSEVNAWISLLTTNFIIYCHGCLCLSEMIQVETVG